MRKYLLSAAVLFVMLQPAGPAGQTRIRPGGPLRVALLVDSSTAAASMINSFREALQGFLDALPGDPEIGLFTTGGVLRIRSAPNSDRRPLEEAIANFAPDGGANVLLRALLETDSRFLQTTTRRPIVVILTTDIYPVVERRSVADYNEFLAEFMNRGGRAHAVVIRGSNPAGLVTQIAENLTQNTGGFFETVLTDTSIPQIMKTMAAYVAADE